MKDVTEFRKQVESIIEARFRFADDPCELWEGEWMQRWHDLEVMVFGKSDIFDAYFDPSALLAAADAVGTVGVSGADEAGKLISDLVNTWDRIPKSVLDPDYEKKWIAYLDVRDRVLEALLTNQPESTYPPVSGGALEMDADDTACGQVCQDQNDRMWAELGPVDDVELPF